MLIAMPSLREGPFARSVVFICAHRDDGAMGLIINKRSPDVAFAQLLVKLKIVEEAAVGQLPPAAEGVIVLQGGPVEVGRGFVLHSDDFAADDTTISIVDGVCLTASLDILRAIANGAGPRRAVLALGYAGWSPGQLESEIRANGWLSCEADRAIIFDADHATKYDRALARLGVSAAALSSEAGHA